jgi:DNA-binding transcriptional ArsR family regulator
MERAEGCGMSIQAVAQSISINGLSPATKLVLMLLANRHNWDTDLCFPKQSSLAEEAGMSVRSVRTHLNELEKQGLICRSIERGGKNKSDVTHYKLMFLGRQNLPVETLERKSSVVRPENERTLERQLVSAPYKDKPEGNRKEPSREPKRIPDDWEPTAEHERKAKVDLRFRDDQWDLAVQEFVEYWRSMKGKAGKKISWSRTFTNNLNTLSARWQTTRNKPREDQSPEQPKSLADWKQAAANYCELGVWPADLGPPPHQPGCKAPVGLLKSIAKRLEGDNRHQAIIHNIGEAA